MSNWVNLILDEAARDFETWPEWMKSSVRSRIPKPSVKRKESAMSTFRTGSLDHAPIVMEAPISTIGAVTSCPQCGQPLQQLSSERGRELVCIGCRWSGVISKPIKGNID